MRVDISRERTEKAKVRTNWHALGAAGVSWECLISKEVDVMNSAKQ
jgi:hypothetical protein